jgi:hypothetical protein
MIRPALLFIILAGLALGDTLTLDTAPLETSGTGPFTIDFQFDSLDQAVTNMVTLSGFTFGGGSLDGSPSSEMGGITVGTGPFSVTLTNSSFYNDVQFAFTPGSSLSFNYSATSNSEPDTPDTFTFAIFDGTGNEIPTDNPNAFDSFLELDLPANGAGTNAILSGSSGYSVDIAAPTVQSGSPGGGGSVVPEPSALPLLGIAGLIVVGVRTRRRA